MFLMENLVFVFVCFTLVSCEVCPGETDKNRCCQDYRAVNGTCVVCPSGTIGDECKDVCPENFFGVGCRKECECTENTKCDRKLGCVPIVDECPSGTIGDECKDVCPENYFGVGCRKECECTENTKCDRKLGCVPIVDENNTDESIWKIVSSLSIALVFFCCCLVSFMLLKRKYSHIAVHVKSRKQRSANESGIQNGRRVERFAPNEAPSVYSDCPTYEEVRESQLLPDTSTGCDHSHVGSTIQYCSSVRNQRCRTLDLDSNDAGYSRIDTYNQTSVKKIAKDPDKSERIRCSYDHVITDKKAEDENP